MQRWRERLCAAADLIVTPSAAILPPRDAARQRSSKLEWGADTGALSPRRGRVRCPFTPPPGIVAVFAGAFRSWHGAIHLARAIRALRERGRTEISALFIGDGPELPAVKAEAAGLEHVVFTGALPHALMPAALASAHIGVAPFDIGAHKPLALGFYWSPLKIFEYMASGLPVVAPAVARIPQLVGHGREGLLYDPADRQRARRRARASSPTMPSCAARLGAAARERAVREYSWRGALPRARRRAIPRSGFASAMNILLPTDSFPPKCGGSGWSTYELARGLRERGHDVLVVKVVAGKSGAEAATRLRRHPRHRVPRLRAGRCRACRNYFKNERLYPRLAQPARRADRREQDRRRPRPARALGAARR